MVIPAMLCFPGFLTVFFHTPWCFRMFLPVFLRFSLVFLLFPRSVSLVSYFRFCGLILHQQLSKHSTWWRCLEDDFRLRLQNTSSRRLEDFLIKTNIFALVIRLQDVLVKTNIFVVAICFQDVFKTSSRRPQDVLPRHLQDVLQKLPQDIYKTSSRLFQDIFKTSIKDNF